MQRDHHEPIQPSLLDPPAVEITLRCGIVYETEHVQFQVEVRSATDDVLLHMWSYPHVDLAHTEFATARALSIFMSHLGDRSAPFR